MTTLLALGALILTPQTAGGRTFYVDAKRGNDAAPGSAGKPWRSLKRVERHRFLPGDRLLLTSGQTFTTPLRLKNLKGTKSKPILIASQGKTPAKIAAGAGDGLVLDGGADVAIENLTLVGAGRKRNDGRGILLRNPVRVRVNGIEVSGFRLAGVEVAGGEDVLVTRVHAHANGFAGIHVLGAPRAKRITVRDCRAIGNAGDPKNLTNHSGNGILFGGVDEGLIEYCEAAGNGGEMPRTGNGPVGIWAWNSDRITIQHCISHDNLSPGADGGGFDLDGGVTNSVLQYNLSYGNVGCGYLLCQFEGGGLWRNNVVRYNVSYHDGRKNFEAGIGIFDGGGRISDAQIYNNTIVNPKHAVSALNTVPGLVFRNNLFLADGEAIEGKLEEALFERNLVWRAKQLTLDHTEAHVSPGGQDLHNSRHVNPRVVLPASAKELPTDPRKLRTMRFFRIPEGSPGHGAGMSVPNNGGRDLFGRPIPADAPSIGAAEG